MIETWIDALARVWEIPDGRGGALKSYRLFEIDEFPSTISVFPSAISYVTGVQAMYDAASAIDLWTGITEIHCFPENKSRMAEALRYFERIKAAAAANITLGGLVSYFLLTQDAGQNIIGPVSLEYGDAAPNTGFVVHWTVKENVTTVVGG